MDRKQTRHPYDSASVFSRFLFKWLFPLLIKGRKEFLKEDDLYETSQYHSSEYLGNLLQKEWNKEVKKNNPSIFKALLRFIGWKYLIVVFLALIQETVVFTSQAYILGVIINHYENKSEWNELNVYLSCAAFIVLTIIYMLIYNIDYFIMEVLGMKLKISFCTLIYRKAINLSSSSLAKSNVGQMVNLLANDVSKFNNNLFTVLYLCTNPFLIIITTILLWKYYGWAIIVGMSAILIFIPMKILFAKLYSKLRLQAAILGDERLNLLNEMIAGMRLVKMYTWELPYAALIEKIRAKEIKTIRKFLYARGILLTLGFPLSRLFSCLTFLVFFLFGGQLNAQIVFVTTMFSIIIYFSVISIFSFAVNLVAEIFISLKRLQHFLLLQEKDNSSVNVIEERLMLTKCGVWMENVTAAWNKEYNPTLDDISLSIKPGELLTIIGSVGSGKTSLLMSILREIPIISGRVSVKGKVSYASQEAWIFNGTIRENILFGEEYRERKYREILKITALEKDISLFPEEDLTVVGERGVMMSGGQKARINLARALYVDADIFLLDDPLSAVDAPVAKHLFVKCIKEYLKEKVCILVTHQIQFLNSTTKILVLNKGKCEFFGNYNQMKISERYAGNSWENEIVKSSMELSTVCFNDKEILDNKQVDVHQDVEVNNNVNTNHKQRREEDKRHGVVGLSVYKAYVNAGAGLFLKFLILIMLFLTQAVYSFSDYWIIKWLNDEKIYNQNREKFENFTSETSNTNFTETVNFQTLEFNMYIFFGLVCATFVLTIISASLFYEMFMAASKKLHNNMFRCIIRTPISFLDSNPVARSPVFSHLSVSLYGLTTIRAFNAENKFKSTFNKYQDKHTATWFIYVALNRWNCAYSHFFCLLNLIISFVVLSVSINEDDAGSKIGLVTNYGLLIFLLLQWSIKQSSEVEYLMNSVTRILNYSNLKPEAAYESSPEIQPPADWPQKGEIEFKNVSLRYSKGKNTVLNNLSFRIKSGEKIGIVGRTGAGKSSIISTLFRMTEPTGTIIIDGVVTQDIGLRDLRSKISIIPQDPILFTGPLRRNIDPFNEYSEEILWQAIEEVQLKEVIGKLPGGLDAHLAEGGRNFSIGQRQLICLARAILRQNKILVMDEATSNIDNTTDSRIQKIVREKLQSCTVLTIAHRLHTIIDSDRVLVLDKGKIQEFDMPYKLLENKEGTFYNLVKNTGNTSMKQLNNTAKDKYYCKEITESTKL
ncbi:ATP-binding cassette sub-family C member 4-like [Centruroides vittatus]|uniref:ATP-binding cassette sub-family C member 4-like n=1 Tax=Centruroides vittatus TaxID=120091 RepID=UPI0035105630